MIDSFEWQRLVNLFGTRIGNALVRSKIYYSVLLDWFFDNCLFDKLLKVRGIGYQSALFVLRTLQDNLFKS